MQPSPYTPGEIARHIPGRGRQIEEIRERLSFIADLQRLAGRIRVDHAPRGWGKTSLLAQAERMATEAGLLPIWVTAGEQRGLVATLAAAIEAATSDWKNSSRLRERLDRLTVTVTVGVPRMAQLETTRHPKPSDDDAVVGSQELEAVLRDTVTAALDHRHRGVVLLIDEIQDADRPGLRTLAYAVQRLQITDPGLPVGFFAAGLPTSPEAIGRAFTPSERFQYRNLGLLDADATQLALSQPAGALGVTWEPAALSAAAANSRGYPYAIQLIGDSTWKAAGLPDPGGRLTLEHLARARPAADSDIASMFRARWVKATPMEQTLLRALAVLTLETGGRPVGRADVAAAMGVTSNQLSVPRSSLIDKGLLHSPSRGILEFTVPGFAEFIADLDEPSPPGAAAPDDAAELRRRIDELQHQLQQLENPPGPSGDA